ncbi:hypothetical protein H4S08_000402 [Coemansia sp. RSA 1365]|nr:hypothetical protein H4S08_000402 [Coemansia sp. RSA 1365]
MNRREMEIRNRVSYVARRHFDMRRRRCDWEEISFALQIPLLQCLYNFDASHSRIMPRHMTEDKEWTLDDIEALKSFIEIHFHHRMTVDDWVLAGKYMNVYHSDCISKMWALNAFQMTPQLFAQISELRQAGLLWPTICSTLSATNCTPDIMRFVYSTTTRENVQRLRRPKAQFRISKHQHWTEDEDRQLISLLERFGDGHDIDWNFISKAIGHSKNACRYRRILLRRSQKSREPSQCSSTETEISRSDIYTKSHSPKAK